MLQLCAGQNVNEVHLGAGGGGVYAAGAEGLDTVGEDTAGEDTTVSETEPARARLPTEPRAVLGEFFHDPLARGCHLPLEAARPPEGLETWAGADGDETAGAAGAAGALPPLQKKERAWVRVCASEERTEVRNKNDPNYSGTAVTGKLLMALCSRSCNGHRRDGPTAVLLPFFCSTTQTSITQEQMVLRWLKSLGSGSWQPANLKNAGGLDKLGS